jgi:peroxiredoxin
MYIGRLARSAMLAGVVAMGSVAAPVSAGGGSVKVGQPAPDFTLTLIDGTKVTRDELHGQVVVLNFWATWCVPCRTELPTLDTYYMLQQKTGLRVFAVTTEDSLPLFQLKKLFAAMHMQPARKIKGPYYTMGGVPTNIVIGRDGRIRYAKAAAFDVDSLNQILVPLLKEPAPPPLPAAAP